MGAPAFISSALRDSLFFVEHARGGLGVWIRQHCLCILSSE